MTPRQTRTTKGRDADQTAKLNFLSFSFSGCTTLQKFQVLLCALNGQRRIVVIASASVGEAQRFYKLDPSAVTVFYDEIDLAAGKVRVKMGGGSGGHNGIRSLDQHIGNNYRRVRIGVGHPGVKEMVHGHVLGDFAKADREWLDVLLDAVADCAGMLAKGDDSGFMNRVTLTLREKLQPTGEDDAPPPKAAKPKPSTAQSHIRQARPQQPAAKLPESGPMAAMLKKLLGKE